MLDLLYLLSLMSLRAEDLIRDSQEFPTASTLDTFSSIPSEGPVPNPGQASWHSKHGYCPNQYVHAGKPSPESMRVLRCLISFEPEHPRWDNSPADPRSLIGP
jgi:hypothetical protein